MSPAAEQACRFVHWVAQAQPHHDNAPAQLIVSIARKVAAEIRREQFHTSRSGVPLTRKA